MLPKGSAATARKSFDALMVVAVAWQPSPKLSVEPAQVVLALLAVAPPAIVVMVKGRAMGLLGNPIIVGRLMVTVMGAEADPAKPPLPA